MLVSRDDEARVAFDRVGYPASAIGICYERVESRRERIEYRQQALWYCALETTSRKQRKHVLEVCIVIVSVAQRALRASRIC